MGAFEETGRFLEARLEEFLKAHPTLELQVLDDQLCEQEAETQKILRQLTLEVEQAQQNILKTAAEVQRWHERIAKAEQANRPDLAQAAREREAELLRQGNQQWAQMSLAQQQMESVQTLTEKLHRRRQELQIKLREQSQTQSSQSPTPKAWQSATKPRKPLIDQQDPLEAQFKAWELEAELEALKRKMGH